MGNSKNFIRVMIVLGVLIVAGLYYLYLKIGEAGDRWPAYKAPGTLVRMNEQLESDIAKLRSEVAKIEPAKKLLEDLKVEYDLATRVLPRENTPDQLIASIRTKAHEAGVIPEVLTPSVAAAPRQRSGKASFEEWSFSLNIRGDYDQIATFVNRMEEFESADPEKTGSEKRFFKVSSITIAAEDGGLGFFGPPVGAPGSTQRGHNCALTMQTYRYTGALAQ